MQRSTTKVKDHNLTKSIVSGNLRSIGEKNKVDPTELGNYSVSLLSWKYVLPLVEHKVLSHCMKNSHNVLEFWGFGLAFFFHFIWAVMVMYRNIYIILIRLLRIIFEAILIWWYQSWSTFGHCSFPKIHAWILAAVEHCPKKILGFFSSHR